MPGSVTPSPESSLSDLLPSPTATYFGNPHRPNMVNALSLALVAVAAGSTALRASAQICYTYNFEVGGIDYVGNDIANVKSASPYDCCARCANQLACNAFSWTKYEGGTCWLKSTKGETKPSNGTTSAYDRRTNSTSVCPDLQNDIAYTGPSLATFPDVKSAGDCCIECAKNSQCATFTWNRGSCTLQSSIGATKGTSGAVSGARQTVDPTCPPIWSGVAYRSKYLTTVSGIQSGGECCAQCQQNKQCAVFSWYFNSANAVCELYTAGARLEASDGAFSGVPNGSCSPIEENVDYGGSDIGNFRVSKAEDCCGLCQATENCGAYSWNKYNGGTCWFKTAKGTSTTRNGVRSAVVNRA